MAFLPFGMVFLITDDDIRCKMKKRDLSKAFEDRRDFTPSPIVVFQRVTTPGSVYYYQDETLQLQLKVKKKLFPEAVRFGEFFRRK